MIENFNDCLTRLLKDEGGYTNDPSDSGGATNFGITIADYRLYINKDGTPADVKDMKLDDAKHIYKTKYWDAIGGDDLPSGVDYTCFDYAVNSGLGRPRKALDAFKSLGGTELIDAINNERMAFLQALVTRRPKDAKFMKGWTNRVAGVRKYSKYLSKGTNKTAGPAVGAGAVAVGFASSEYFTDYKSAIIIASLLVAIAVGVAIHLYKNKGT